MYVISTPVGNLKDFSFRAVEIIEQLDYLLCEDTRRTRILLNHYELKVSLRSFHAHSEGRKLAWIIEDIEAGKQVGLVSDAGTPLISDPGTRLIAACRKQGLKVVAVPGACAALIALTASGLETTPFQFVGFLPRKKGKLTRLFENILTYPGTTICYESPYRLVSTLSILAQLDPLRQCVVAREVTKKFEEYVNGPIEEIFKHFSKKSPKGEIVLIISR